MKGDGVMLLILCFVSESGEAFIIVIRTHFQIKYTFESHALKKSHIRETKHLSTDADSSTDTTVGRTKNTQKPKCFEKWN